MDIAGYIDHTVLAADATKERIESLCREAEEYGFASVCVNSCWVPLAARLLEGSTSKVCTVVGFPLGAMESDAKAYEARKAVENGADYVGVGSIFRTSTKPDACQALGLGAIFEVRHAVDVPVVAIGGINRGNIQDVIRAGADAAAVVSAVVAQDDVSAAAHELRDLILKVRPHIPPEYL